MAEQKMISEKEAVMRERAAFRLGARTYACAECREMMERDNGPAAAVRYPLPKVTRPRVVPDDSWEPQWGKPREWRCIDGRLESRTIGFRPGYEVPTEFSWTTHCQAPITAQRCRLWADLLANPTEEVEDV